MANERYADAAFAIGTTPPMIENVMATATSQDDTSDFGSWFQSEKGQVMIGGLFNAISSLGIGFAGLPAGGADMSSLGRGAAGAANAWNLSQAQYDNRQFTNFIDGEIKTEEGRDTPDREKLMTLQMMRRNPDEWIKGSASSDNWMAKYNYADKLGQDRVEAKRMAEVDFASRNFNTVVDAKDQAALLAGDSELLARKYMRDPALVQLWVAKGGRLDGVQWDGGLGKSDDSAGWWKKLKDWATGDDEDDGSEENVAGVDGEVEKKAAFSLPELTKPDYPETFTGGFMKFVDQALTLPYKAISGGPPGLMRDVGPELDKYLSGSPRM